ncbi:transmembrane protein [Tilletiaria anomala UBC 951]|uniref:ER membrane protein complex subunit 3 n=1 Tax=Tilletiaria anomala (strain ATCC 24038 / CBS 436.72 / UBC 951) TaxID=1037660 RepID=A0A066WGU9_TILAU|nr:uncharacterized protein K437DRAFT_255183 [Tilletiaria anomala UBC 951]KDN49925.1 transmembrane protein [Tilletiaria anomala UBC 951]
MAIDQSLYLDSAIRDWVLIPITLVMVLVGVLRHNVTMLINSPPKKSTLAKIREQRVLGRSQALQANYFQLPPSSFVARRAYLIDALGSGKYLADPVKPGSEPNKPKNPLTEPGGMDSMMEGMKKSMVMMVPQTVIMGWINFFFSGFVLIKLPFPLTLRFKPMLQRGIETPDMDVTWVSSLSWYFLNLFGLNAIYRLVLGDGNAADGTRDMAAMGNMAGAGMPGLPGQTPDVAKIHAAERDNLELAGLDLLDLVNRPSPPPGVRRWIGDGIEGRVLALYTR